MPCLSIHLAVAKEYLKNHKDENEEEFILGTIAPDIDLPNIGKYINGVNEGKSSQHFGKNLDTSSLVSYSKSKVDFNEFFKFNDITSSFLRAYFLHLICDYYFFGEYIPKDILENYSLQDAVKIGYNDYDLITPILVRKYDLTIPYEVKDFFLRQGVGEIRLLHEELVDRFIKEMSSKNLEDEKKNLLNQQRV